MTLKQKVYQVIFNTETRAGRIFDEVLLTLIFLSVVMVMVRSVEQIAQNYSHIFRITERIITVLFSIEYLLRIWCNPKPRSYIFSFYGIIDLLAVLPSYIGGIVRGHNLIVLRSLRLLRLFRILKLGRYTSASSLLWKSLQDSAAKITVFLLTVFIIVLIIGTMMYLIEGPEAGFVNIPTAVYRAIVTITTVGYGDITPLTPIGQFLSAALMIIGYGIIAVPTGIVTAQLTEEKMKKEKKKKHKKKK